MKALFLDIDEVLVTHASRTAFAGRKMRAGAIDYGLDPVGVGLIRRLCVPNYTTLFVSSAWRLHRTVHQLANILCLPVDGITPIHDDMNRGNEIAECLAANAFDDYVVIDDGIAGLERFQLAGRLIQTEAGDGFGWAHYLQACEILRIDSFTGAPLPDIDVRELVRKKEAKAGHVHDYSFDEWRPWTGENYIKVYYDVEVQGSVIKHCWPNTGLLTSYNGRHTFGPSDGVLVRISSERP